LWQTWAKSRHCPHFAVVGGQWVAARLAVRQSYQPKKDEESDTRNDGDKSLTIRARFALAALGLGLLVLGPTADAQTTTVASAANTKAKDAKAQEAKLDTKSKDSKAKDAKSKDSKSKDSKSKGKDSKSGKTAAKSSTPEKKADTAPSVAYAGPASAADVARVKTAVGLARQGKTSQATDEQQSITDPAARKLVEWAILRSDDNNANFSRYAAFIAANPGWPAAGALRRRAEAMLWVERVDPATVRAFFAKEPPLTAKGKFALARALIAQGDRNGAQGYVREAWHNDSFSDDLEDQAMETFGNLITNADHKSRMDMRLYAEDTESGLRSAKRAGGHAQAIAKARIAVIKKAGDAKAQLDAVPAEAKRDVGYIFSSAQWLRRADRAGEAAALVLSIPRDSAAVIDTDQWWIERRLIARKLLDDNDAKTAYQVARNAAVPSRENYRVEHQFTAGWIALRFLNDAPTAQTHFSKIAQGITNPIALARASYWQGRAVEAMGRQQEARAHYQTAAQYPTAYYGQIARAKLGMKDLVLRPPPERHGTALHEVVRAIDLLYAVGERDLVAGMLADYGDRTQDAAVLGALGEVTTRNKDARATLLLGKAALGRGLPLEHHAFPVIGIPDYKAVGPAIDLPTVYAIARQESTFNQRTVSTAKAMGLMQVTPEAGRYVAKKFNVSFDAKRLMSDPIYNVQLGAAELGDLFEDYRGSYILSFAGYNAGRGRVRDWVARFGDPRDPNVDPIDWVERIPFSETRNYVQRVLENLQVYRVRFGGGSKLLIEADLRRGGVAN
jgi:peptidoglycan lytic transglycosylase